MTQSDVRISERFIYRSVVASTRHRRSVSAYLVERSPGSTIVARIEPLGLIPRSMSDYELVLQGLRRNLVLTGPWRTSVSRRHVRVLVRPVGATEQHSSKVTEP